MAQNQASATGGLSTDDENTSPQSACPPSQGMGATYIRHYDGSYMHNSHNAYNIDNSIDNHIDQSVSTTIIQRQTVFQRGEANAAGSGFGLEDILRLKQHQRQMLYSERVEPSLHYLRDAYLATHRNMEEFRYSLYMHTEGIERPDSDERFDLEQRVLAFLKEDAHPIVCLIQGSAGSGKSTFIHHLARQLWSKYQEAQDQAVIPLYISLASLHSRLKKSCSQDLIAAYFKEQHFNDEQIRIVQFTCRFVFILDGYDEIEKRTGNFYADNQLDRWKAKVIVTSRPEYLGQGYQSQFYPQRQPLLLQEFWIAPFSTNTIQRYISRYVATNPQGHSIENYQQWVTQPDLRALISNPFLLRMVVSVAPELGESAITTRGALYEKFIDSWFQRAQERLRHIPLPKFDSEVFNEICDDFIHHGKNYCQRFALALYCDKALEVTYSQFQVHTSPQLNENWRPLLSNNDPQARLLRFSSPLICRDRTYRFLHKSLRDYIVAQAFWQDPSLATCSGNALITQFYIVGDPGVIDFVVDEARRNTVLQQQLLEWVHGSKTDTGGNTNPAAANALTILVRAGMCFTQQDLRGIRVAGADLSHGWFEGTQLQNADISNVQLRGAWLREADISEAKLNDIEFGEMPFLQHTGLNVCCYSLDGQLFASSGNNYTIRLWSVPQQQQPLYIFQGHDSPVLSVDFSPDGQFLASGSEDHTIRLWSVPERQLLHIFEGHSRAVQSVDFSPDGQFLASGSEDHTIRLLSVPERQLLHIFEGHSRAVQSVDFSPDSQFLASGSEDHTIRLWSVSERQLLHIFEGHSRAVRSVDFSPDSQLLASGSFDCTIRLWSVPQRQLLHIINHTSSVRSVDFSPDGQLLASGCDLTLRLWSVPERQLLHIFGSGHIQSVEFSPDGQFLASGSCGSIRLWSVPQQQQQSLYIFKGHDSSVLSVDFSPDGQFLASGSDDSTVCLWSVEQRQLLHIFEGHSSAVLTVNFSPDGQFLASGSEDHTIRLWSVSERQPLHILKGHSNPVESVDFSPDGQFLASGSYNSIRLWAVPQQQLLHIVKGDGGVVISMDFSPDGQLLALGDYDSTVYLWSVPQRQLLHIFEGHSCEVVSVNFSPDGEFLASGSEDHTIRLWSVPECQPIHIFKGHSSSVQSVDFSPDGQLLASGSFDRTIRLWSVPQRKCLFVVSALPAAINSLSWHRDTAGGLLATGSSDKAVRLWHVQRLKGHTLAVTCRWSSHYSLNTTDLKVWGARGLSPVNQRLLKQRGAIGVSEQEQGERTKRRHQDTEGVPDEGDTRAKRKCQDGEQEPEQGEDILLS